MNFRLLLAAAVLTMPITAYAAPDQSFDRTISVSAQPDLYISTGSGSIRVRPGSGGQIHIVGHVHAGWSAFGGEVDARVTKIVQSPPITQNGNAVHVGDVNDHHLFNNISIDYEVTVPADVALNLKSGSGDLEVDHVGRFLAASSGSGSVRAHGLKGPADLDSGSGDIELEDEGQGNIKARTGSGSIRLHGFDGMLNAKTGSGDIEGEGNLQGAASLSSGSGSVRLRIAPSTRFNLEATTGSGDIRVHFPNAPQQDDKSRHHLTAPINGGGPPLEVHTGSGDIEIAAR